MVSAAKMIVLWRRMSCALFFFSFSCSKFFGSCNAAYSHWVSDHVPCTRLMVFRHVMVVCSDTLERVIRYCYYLRKACSDSSSRRLMYLLSFSCLSWTVNHGQFILRILKMWHLFHATQICSLDAKSHAYYHPPNLTKPHQRLGIILSRYLQGPVSLVSV